MFLKEEQRRVQMEKQAKIKLLYNFTRCFCMKKTLPQAVILRSLHATNPGHSDDQSMHLLCI